MAASTGQGVTVGRRPTRRVGRILAGQGAGWSLWVPVDQWDRMTEIERAQLVEGQAALLEGG